MYFPVKLHAFISLFGSGIVTVLFERIDPDNLNVLRAIAGS